MMMGSWLLRLHEVHPRTHFDAARLDVNEMTNDYPTQVHITMCAVCMCSLSVKLSDTCRVLSITVVYLAVSSAAAISHFYMVCITLQPLVGLCW